MYNYGSLDTKISENYMLYLQRYNMFLSTVASEDHV